MTLQEQLLAQGQAQQNVYGLASIPYNPTCRHPDCPVCKAEKEAEEIAKKVKADEYKARCEKYMAEWRVKHRKELR